MKKIRIITIEKKQRNLLLCKLSEKLTAPGTRHTLQPDANKYPIFGYLMQDEIIENKITELIYNN